VRFADPEALLLLLWLPLSWALRARFWRVSGGVPLPGVAAMAVNGYRFAGVRTIALELCRGLIVVGLVVALARPQSEGLWVNESQQGVDIVLALDISGSMRAEDFQPVNRLVAAREVIGGFITNNPDNRLALVAFAGRSVTVVPLTRDHAMVRQALARIDFTTVRQDGTAIGDAIGNGLYRLKESNPKGRVIVLFTDGENNSGYLEPLKAAAMARVKGVRVHTIAVGQPGGAPIPVLDADGQKTWLKDGEGRLILPQINEETLQRIANLTGGQYFRATDTQGLRRVYAAIEKLEKTPFEVRRQRVFEDRYAPLVAGVLVLFLLLLFLQLRGWRLLVALPGSLSR
jgi:Ca-activated chloride channel family protein